MPHSINWIDLICLAAVVLGVLSGLSRGFAREFIGLFGWVIAASLANRWYPELLPKIQPYIPSETIAGIISFVVIFLLICIFINMLANLLVGARSSRITLLGRSDKLLGGICGAVKGYAFLCILYLLGTVVFPSAEWPDVLQESQAVPIVYQGAAYINNLLPNAMQRDIPVPQVKMNRTQQLNESLPDSPNTTDPSNAPAP